MKTNPRTHLLGVLVLMGLVVTFVRHSQTIGILPGDNDSTKLSQEKKNRFPTANYDEPDSNDPQKDHLRKEKQKRHNDFKIVTSNPPEWQAERVFVGEGALNFPALPVAESTNIVLGKVINAEAHLSENKKNGRKLLYRISSTNMPAINERYLFFLLSKNNEDLSILTAYTLTPDGVVPLDESSQFEAMRGLTEEALLQKLLQSSPTASPY